MHIATLRTLRARRRPALSFAACALFACASSHAGNWGNGHNLNGVNLNGSNLNGVSVNGVNYNGTGRGIDGESRPLDVNRLHLTGFTLATPTKKTSTGS